MIFTSSFFVPHISTNVHAFLCRDYLFHQITLPDLKYDDTENIVCIFIKTLEKRLPSN